MCLFKMGKSCQNTFDAFKHALVTVPVLAFPDFSQPFDLYVDASLEGIGMTLGQTQKGHEVAIAYGGRDLTPVERNYSATEHEALTVVPMPFKWLMTVKDPTGRLARWSLLLQQFDFTIHHRAGKSNGNADALSSRPYCDAQMNVFSGAGVQTDVIRFYQRHDTNFLW